MAVFSGWRAAVWLLVALIAVGLLLTVIFWAGVLLALAVGVAWFNLGALPRLAARLRINQLVLAVALLPLLAAAGFALGGIAGIVAGSGVWVAAVALPRGLMWRFRRRLRSARGSTQLSRVRVIDSGFRIKHSD